MDIVTTESVARGTKNISFKFQYNRVDENVSSFNTNYIIDLNGYIYQNSPHSKDTSVTILGGDSRFLFEKSYRSGSEYMTKSQIVALSSILQHLSKYTAFANVSSNDDYLNNVVNSLYGGYKN